MIVEIGTSDFRTHAGRMEGIYIEPVKEYFDRLPKCNKVNCAISDYEGTATVFFVDPDKIAKHSLPNWLRGCNSIHEIHPTVSFMISDGKISPTWVKSYDVPVRRIKSVLDEYHIQEINVLKIDTEGHDCVILNDFLDTVDTLPNTIQFESNVLSDKAEIDKAVERLRLKGYNCQQVNFDMVCKLIN